MLRNSNEAWKFVNKHWGWETGTRPDTKLKPVPYKKSVLHDFLESEEMTLLIGDDCHYYTVQDKRAPYGDYAETEYQWYGRFNDPALVRQQLAI